MGLHKQLNKVLEIIDKEGDRAVLCYRNTGSISYRNGKIYCESKQILWRDSWYFDQSYRPFYSARHFRHYAGSSAVVIDSNEGNLGASFDTRRLYQDITASAWCSLEICLTQNIYIVNKHGHELFVPGDIARSRATHDIFRHIYRATQLWAGDNNINTVDGRIKKLVEKAVRMSNHNSPASVEMMCEAIMDYGFSSPTDSDYDH
jgi:hypothetical protein